jgi:hypothetical protein
MWFDRGEAEIVAAIMHASPMTRGKPVHRDLFYRQQYTLISKEEYIAKPI